MPRYRRTDRINEQLKQEVSVLIRDAVRDPRVGMVTITAVQTSPELDHATVYFTVLGDETEKEQAEQGLQSAAAFLRGQLGRRLHMRRVPELHFRVDRTLEGALRVESLLREVLPAESGEPEEKRDDEVDGHGEG